MSRSKDSNPDRKYVSTNQLLFWLQHLRERIYQLFRFVHQRECINQLFRWVVHQRHRRNQLFYVTSSKERCDTRLDPTQTPCHKRSWECHQSVVNRELLAAVEPGLGGFHFVNCADVFISNFNARTRWSKQIVDCLLNTRVWDILHIRLQKGFCTSCALDQDVLKHNDFFQTFSLTTIKQSLFNLLFW